MSIEIGNLAAKRRQKDALSYMSVTIASEISMVCAIILFFFVHLSIPVNYATGGTLFAILLGTILCWRSIIAAETIMIASVLGSELVVLSYFPGMLLPFIVMDVVAFGWLATLWNITEKS